MNQSTYDSPSNRSISWINLIAGIWMIIAPFVWGASVPLIWDSVIVGILLVIFAAIRLGSKNSGWASWINGILGLWLIIAPWVLGNATPAPRWNCVIIGIIVAYCAFFSANAAQTSVPK